MSPSTHQAITQSTEAQSTERSILGRRWEIGLQNSSDQRLVDAMVQRLGLPDVVAQIMVVRGAGLDDVESLLNPSLRAMLPDPSGFKDMDRAVERLADAIRDDEKIAIFGDYDVDGATSSALLILGLRSLDVVAEAYIPDRLTEGYGLSEQGIRALHAKGVRLVIAVDCGTQSFRETALAEELGLDIIIIDHHKSTTQLPAACALVNPNRFDDPAGREYGHLAAVGLAFLFMAGLMRYLRQRGWFDTRPEPSLMPLLDLVALGTVADVAPLTGVNRAFVAQGLKILRQGGNPGLAALVAVCNIKQAVKTSDLGFYLGPRINAAGRIGNSCLGVTLLTTEDPAQADSIAQDLNRLNQERQALEMIAVEEAQAQAQEQDDPILLLGSPNWHPGIIGIIAGRLKERLRKPCLILSIGEDGQAKGSGRSLPGYDIGAAVLRARDAGVLIAAGGHSMAAGVTVDADKMAKFHRWLCADFLENQDSLMGDDLLRVDTLISAGGLTLDLAHDLERIEPCGQGWPKPRIAVGPVQCAKADIVGGDHIRLFMFGPEGARFKAMAFRQADTLLGQALLASKGRALTLVGRVVTNAWNGSVSAELHIEDARYA